VTATALDLAFTLCQGPVYITGMDLGRRDIQTHARPYSFERLLTEGASRLNPAYSQTFVRASSIAASSASGSLGIYAQWFARQLAAYPDRLFSLGNNSSVFNNRSINGITQKTETIKKVTAEIVLSNDEPSAEMPASVLLRALESDTTRETLLRELGPLLFCGDSAAEASPETIRAEICAAGGAYG
jgi:hypothetical protein